MGGKKYTFVTLDIKSAVKAMFDGQEYYVFPLKQVAQAAYISLLKFLK